MILTEEAKVPIRCERCQVDPEVVSRSVRHSGVPGRHGKPLKENSPQRRYIKFTSHMEHAPGKQNKFQDAEVKTEVSVSQTG